MSELRSVASFMSASIAEGFLFKQEVEVESKVPFEIVIGLMTVVELSRSVNDLEEHGELLISLVGRPDIGEAC